MNFSENIRVAFGSIRENLLRTVITAAIIATGITALVGILTAIDSIQASIDNSFADLGANSFDIVQKGKSFGRRRGSRDEKLYPPITYQEASRFKEQLSFTGTVSISTSVTGAAEAKFMSEKTNPNTEVVGGDENYLAKEGYTLKNGRNFSSFELENGANVAMIGKEIAEVLFENRDPLNLAITLLGRKYKVIGVLEEKGSNMGGGGADRIVIIPLEQARLLISEEGATFDIQVKVRNPAAFTPTMEEATGILRLIRGDEAGRDNSFEIKKSETLADRFGEITGYLKLGGGLIGFITIIGASIGLMNIMLVSVTERTREIGVRKALGATPRRIQQQFLIEAIVICQLGGILGIILGILIGNLVAVLIGVGSFVVPWLWMVVGLTICVVVGILSGFYPSYKASKLAPIESLRFE
ncbi:MAG: ABC transporter permease [Thermonemataceae bacterium]